MDEEPECLPLIPCLEIKEAPRPPRPPRPPKVIKPKPVVTLTDRVRKALEDWPSDGRRIYFVLCGRFVKIGITAKLEERLETLAASNPHELKLLGHFPGSRQAECAVHDLLKAYRHRYEWFRAAPSVMRMIQAIMAKPPKLPMFTTEPKKRKPMAVAMSEEEHQRYRAWRNNSAA